MHGQKQNHLRGARVYALNDERLLRDPDGPAETRESEDQGIFFKD